MSEGGPYCASHAFLNATRVGDFDLKLFEVAMSTPFGLRHVPDDPYRSVAPFVDPSSGLDIAAPLWGHDSLLFSADDQLTLLNQLKGVGPGQRAVVGPVNMGYLSYLEFAPLYFGYPHYIVVIHQPNDGWLIVDSENYILELDSDADLARILQVGGIPEAGGAFIARIFRPSCPRASISSVLSNSLRRARSNYALTQHDEVAMSTLTRWGLSLTTDSGMRHRLVALYDVNNLIIRRHLLLWFLNCCRNSSLLRDINEVTRLVGLQVRQLSELAGSLRASILPDMHVFETLAQHELKVAQGMEVIS